MIKKQILIGMGIIILLLLIAIVSSQTLNEKTVLTNTLEKKVLKEKDNDKVMQHYKEKLPEAKSIKEYVTDGKHVIISFEGTQYRVITTKGSFDKMIK